MEISSDELGGIGVDIVLNITEELWGETLYINTLAYLLAKDTQVKAYYTNMLLFNIAKETVTFIFSNFSAKCCLEILHNGLEITLKEVVLSVSIFDMDSTVVGLHLDSCELLRIVNCEGYQFKHNQLPCIMYEKNKKVLFEADIQGMTVYTGTVSRDSMVQLNYTDEGIVTHFKNCTFTKVTYLRAELVNKLKLLGNRVGVTHFLESSEDIFDIHDSAWQEELLYSVTVSSAVQHVYCTLSVRGMDGEDIKNKLLDYCNLLSSSIWDTVTSIHFYMICSGELSQTSYVITRDKNIGSNQSLLIAEECWC